MVPSECHCALSSFWHSRLAVVSTLRYNSVVDREDRTLRTQGLAVLTEAEHRQLIRYLKKAGIKYRSAHTKDGDEIVLLNINVSVSGVVPDLMRWLHGLGVDLVDWFQR